MHCKKKTKKKKQFSLKILSQPAKADFCVFSTYFLGTFSTFCCINLKQEVEKTQKSAEAGCLKILSLPNFFFFYSVGTKGDTVFTLKHPSSWWTNEDELASVEVRVTISSALALLSLTLDVPVKLFTQKSVIYSPSCCFKPAWLILLWKIFWEMSFVCLFMSKQLNSMVSNVVCLPTFYETFSVSQNKESYTGLEWHEGE